MRLSIAGRAAATALVVAPLAWACALFVGDLRERPAGRSALAIPGGVVELPLQAGRSVTIPLVADSIPYRGVALRFRAAAPAKLALRLCGPASCTERAIDVQNGEVALLWLPKDSAGGGALSLTATAVSGGPVALRGDPATPAVEVVQGYSWRLPARRAREVFRALAGADLFLAALAASALATAAGLLACCWMAFRNAAAGKAEGPGSGEVR